MADSGLRQLLLLKRIPREPNYVTAKDLHNYVTEHGFDTTLRTVQRDLAALSVNFTLVETQLDGREGIGWSFQTHSVNQGIPLMEPSSALTLLMGYEHLSRLMPHQIVDHILPYIEEAKATLKAFDQRSYSSWVDKVRILPNTVLMPAGIERETIDAIYDALLSNSKFEATYNGKKEQVISPYGLIQRGHTLYLICKYFKFDDIRITAVQRYSNIVRLNEKIDKDKNFDIDNYINSGEMSWPWGENKTIKLKMRSNEWVTFYLQETALSADQTIKLEKESDWSVVSATVNDTHELRWWLLSQGDSVEILQPKALRDWFSEIAKSMCDLYKK